MSDAYDEDCSHFFDGKNMCEHFRCWRDQERRIHTECHNGDPSVGKIREDWVRRGDYPKYCDHGDDVLTPDGPINCQYLVDILLGDNNRVN